MFSMVGAGSGALHNDEVPLVGSKKRNSYFLLYSMGIALII